MKRIISVSYLIAFWLLSTNQINAQDNALYIHDKKISVPGNGGYDYLSIDKTNNRLYVSHGIAVNVIDLNTDKVIGTIEGMQGNHGIAIANEFNKGFISDGKANSIVVFDLKTLKTITIVPISGQKSDAILYDPSSKKVYAFNGDSNNASVLDASTDKEVGTIALHGAPEFAVADGHGLIYNNLEDKNSLDVIDVKAKKVIKSYDLAPCGGPTGLALDAQHQRLFIACRLNKGVSVVNIQSGKVITTLPIGAGVDAVAYDPGTKLIFCSNGDGTTTIIKQVSADKYNVVQTLATQVRAKTLALDPTTHKIYLSVAKFKEGSRTPEPDSFEVLVYKMQ